SGSVNGGDYGLGETLERAESVWKAALRPIAFRELVDVRACNEGASAAGDDGCADGIVRVEPGQAVDQAAGHLGTDRVHGQIVDPDDRDVVPEFGCDHCVHLE